MKSILKIGLNILQVFHSICLYGINKLENLLNPNEEILSLVAKDDIPKDDEYIKKLHSALIEHDKIKNIAISGPYGSGKTSIIQSFKKHYPEYKYLDISLAYFTEDVTKITTEQLEICVLKQLIHRVDKSKLPDSKFDRINSLSRCKVAWYIFIFLIWGWSFLRIFYSGALLKLNLIKGSWWSDFLTSTNQIISILEIIVFISGSIFILSKAIRFLNKMTLKKVSVNGKVEYEKDSSVLNKHLDEIIYFFQKTKYNVVIFEDIDRYNNIGIFSKLREVNFLLNQSAAIKKDIVFIYALKDDLFTKGERTKFFDFIIPVIPIINSSNSENIFLNHFDNDQTIKLNEEFKQLISDISLYVKEMRVLRNIINEFDIFKTKLNRNELKPSKLFALVVYKNVLPDDFARLYSDESFLNTLLYNKKNWIAELEKKKKVEIEKNKDTLNKKDEIYFKNIKELRSLYICEFFKKINLKGDVIKYFIINSSSVNYKNILEDENFNSVKKSKNIIYNGLHSTRPSNISFSELEKSVDPNQTYQEKEELISYDVTKIQTSIEILNKEIDDIEQLCLSELITEDFVKEEIIKFNIPNILMLLIRNKYVDESYTFYISLFQEGGRCKSDDDFLIAVKEGNAKTFSYKIEEPKIILENIWPNEFLNKGVLNVSLVDHILDPDNNVEYKAKNDKLLEQLSNGNSYSLRFIDYYIEKGKYQDKLINLLGIVYSNFWNAIVDNNEYSTEKKDKYLELIIKNCSIDVIKELNKKGNVKAYIEKSPNFLNYYEKINYRHEVMDIISNLDIHFCNLDPHEGDEYTLFNFVDHNCHYKINIAMLKFVLKNNGVLSEKFEEGNYSFIRDSQKTNMIKYIDDNLDEYLTQVHSKLPKSVNEKLCYIEELLNNEDISEDNKIYIIEKCDFKCDVKKIPDTYWCTLVDNNKIIISWNNLLVITAKYDVNCESIIKFLNQKNNYMRLIEVLPSDYTEEHDLLFKKILMENSLEYNVHKIFSENLIVKFDNCEYDTLVIEKVYNLINNNRFVYSSDLYANFKDCYKKDAHVRYLVKVIDEFIEDDERIMLDAEDYISIINLLNDRNEKIKFINIIPLDLITSSVELSNLILDFYLKDNVTDITIEQFISLTNHNAEIKLLTLFTHVYNNFDIPQILLILEKLSQPWNSLKESTQITIDDNEINSNMLSCLQKKDIISTIKNKENSLVGYVKVSNVK